MSRLRILALRHGHSVQNERALRRLEGRPGARDRMSEPLEKKVSWLARKNLAALAPRFEARPPRLALCSPLTRAIETARLVLPPHVEITIALGLAERSWQDLSGLSGSESAKMLELSLRHSLRNCSEPPLRLFEAAGPLLRSDAVSLLLKCFPKLEIGNSEREKFFSKNSEIFLETLAHEIEFQRQRGTPYQDHDILIVSHYYNFNRMLMAMGIIAHPLFQVNCGELFEFEF